METHNWHHMTLSTTLHSPKVVESLLATEEAEDWSKVRSPSRAKRRLKRGFKQNIVHYRKPACFFIKADNTYYIHPEIMEELRRHTSNKFDEYLMKSYSSIFNKCFSILSYTENWSDQIGWRVERGTGWIGKRWRFGVQSSRLNTSRLTINN